MNDTNKYNKCLCLILNCFPFAWKKKCNPVIFTLFSSFRKLLYTLFCKCGSIEIAYLLHTANYSLFQHTSGSNSSIRSSQLLMLHTVH